MVLCTFYFVTKKHLCHDHCKRQYTFHFGRSTQLFFLKISFSVAELIYTANDRAIYPKPLTGPTMSREQAAPEVFKSSCTKANGHFILHMLAEPVGTRKKNVLQRQHIVDMK